MSNVIEQTLYEEGYSATKYLCSRGFITQGCGRNLEANPLTDFEESRIGNLDSWTRKEAMQLLQDDIDKIVFKLKDDVWLDFEKLSNPRKSVVINMVYQLGEFGFSKFKKTRGYIVEDKFLEASIEMLDSKWFREDTPERAQRLSDQMRVGDKWFLNK